MKRSIHPIREFLIIAILDMKILQCTNGQCVTKKNPLGYFLVNTLTEKASPVLLPTVLYI